LARLLAARPWWDLYETDIGLGALFEPPGEENPAEDSSPLAKAKETVGLFSRGRHARAKIRLRWHPTNTTRHAPLIGLGALKIQEASAAAPATANASLLTDLAFVPRAITVPRCPRPSPRLKVWTEMAALAITERFTPPLGAPDTKGDKVLLFDEDPGLLAATALIMGAGQVEAVCSKAHFARRAEEMARLNGLRGLTVTVAGPAPFSKEILAGWEGRFELVAINLSPHLAVKYLKQAGGWLAPEPQNGVGAPQERGYPGAGRLGHGRLILGGIRRGQQLPLLIKAASRQDLTILDSSFGDDWTLMTLSKRRRQDLPVWEWHPGDWLANLSEDELAEVEKSDRSAARKSASGTDGHPPEELDPTEAPQTAHPRLSHTARSPPKPLPVPGPGGRGPAGPEGGRPGQGIFHPLGPRGPGALPLGGPPLHNLHRQDLDQNPLGRSDAQL
jgi:hypothetical protein